MQVQVLVWRPHWSDLLDDSDITLDMETVPKKRLRLHIKREITAASIICICEGIAKLGRRNYLSSKGEQGQLESHLQYLMIYISIVMEEDG